jgi:hypothetical protein
MPSAGFEPAIPATKWPQTYVLDRAATGNGIPMCYSLYIIIKYIIFGQHIMDWTELDSSQHGGSYEKRNKLSGYLKDGEYFDYLNDS